MKKNLFLLFATYFFVIQAWIISFLRNDTKFFALGIINLGIIIIVTISHSYFEKINNKSKENDTASFKKEREMILGEKSHKKKQNKNGLFVFSILFAIIAFFFFKGYLLSNKIIIASGLGFLLFMSLFYGFQQYKHHKFLSLWTSRTYLIIFLIGLLINGFDSTVPEIRQETALGYIGSLMSDGSKQNIEKPQDTYQTEESLIQEQLTGDNETTIQTGEVTSDTGTLIENDLSNKDYLNDGDLTILDAIRFLIDENSISLDTKQNVRFTYISYSNPNYPYFKTARTKKMIGTSTNPDKKIICQTYIVMKGIAQGREITPSVNTLQAYRNKADNIGELNGCQRNKYVTVENL